MPETDNYHLNYMTGFTSRCAPPLNLPTLCIFAPFLKLIQWTVHTTFKTSVKLQISLEANNHRPSLSFYIVSNILYYSSSPIHSWVAVYVSLNCKYDSNKNSPEFNSISHCVLLNSHTCSGLIVVNVISVSVYISISINILQWYTLPLTDIFSLFMELPTQKPKYFKQTLTK